MSASRDDFGIAFRSALLQKGAAQKFSLIFLIIFATIIFFLDIYNFGFMKSARSIINDGIYRVSLVASTPSRFFPNMSHSISNLINTKNENKELKKEIEIFKAKELNVEYLLNQNKNLKKFLDSDETLFDDNIIVAKVLLDKDSPYLKSVIINRGTKSGVLLGMPVLDKNYLIGRVVETNYMSSRVLLLNDLNSRIPVTLGANDTQAILHGKNGNYPSLEYLPEDYKLIAGINVFTSGKDQIFTPGTPIGTTNEKGEVVLFSKPNQLSFIKINLTRQNKEDF
jgi:rod shape-determining protein MreC